MKTERLTGFGLLLLGVGAAVSAILGPLGLGVIELRISDNMENQVIGGEIISLLLVAPVACIAGVLWLRGHRLAPALALAPALYALYTYVTFVLGPEYERYPGNNERFFPLYLALIILGWAVALRAWSAIDVDQLPPPSTGLRRLLAGLLLFVGVVFALAWTAGVVDVLNGGAVPQEYDEHPTLFWLIRLLDLGVIVPAALITGAGLLRHAPWATKLSYALAGFQTRLVGSVAGMAVVMAARDDPSANPVLLVVAVAATAGLGLVTVRLLRIAQHATEHSPDEVQPAPRAPHGRAAVRPTGGR